MNQEQGYHRDIVIKLQLANRLKSEGKYQEAVQVLQDVLAQDTHCAPAYNNLGAIFYICKDYQLAVDMYQAALDIKPDYLDAYYNLALAQTKREQFEEAMITYRALLSLQPEHVGARFQVGILLMRRLEYVAAQKEFSLLLESHPQHFESLANLALCYLQTGRLDLASKCYWQALELVPEDRDILFNLGVIHMQQGYAADGLQYYRRAAKSDPDYFEAHHNLAAIYLMRRDYEQAQYHFQEAIRIQPDNASLRHTLQILKQDKSLTGSEPAYIRSLFDSYASYYEPHILTYLHYEVPEKLHKALLSVIGVNELSGNVLDLGCGTGLCASLFKSFAKKLIGVDLSPNMLDIARQKNLYDELIVADAVEYLHKQHEAFQLIVAADVLVYFGDLSGLLKTVAGALTSGGYFVFNVEIGAEHDFILTLSGRFAHQRSYLEQQAALNGFNVMQCEETILRIQEEQPVKGYLCVFRRS